MRAVIIALCVILIASGYMAISAELKPKAECECRDALLVEVPPPAPAAQEETPKQPPEIPAEQPEEYEEYTPEYSESNTVEEEISAVFGAESRIAMAIAQAESGLNPNAVNRNKNGTKDIGIFQINDSHGFTEEERFDWKTNIRIAKDLRDSNGWGEWSAYNNGSYRNFL